MFIMLLDLIRLSLASLFPEWSYRSIVYLLLCNLCLTFCVYFLFWSIYSTLFYKENITKNSTKLHLRVNNLLRENVFSLLRYHYLILSMFRLLACRRVPY